MGSHYIPVGKIKIDKEILDIACPAAGYTPELICPTAGYELVVPPFIKDEEWPELPQSFDDEIVLLVSSQIGGLLRYNIKCDVSNDFNYAIYGEGNVLLEAGTNGSMSFTKDFSEMEGGYQATGYQTFIIRITPIIGQYLTSFTPITPLTDVNPIIEANINAPNLTVCSFQNCQILKKVSFCEMMNSWNGGTTTVNRPFQYTYSLEEVTMPKSLNGMVYMNYFFNGSGVRKIVFPENMPALKVLDYCFNNCEIKEIIYPINTPLLESARNFIAGTSNLKKVIMPVSDVMASYSSFASGASALEEAIIPISFPLSLFQATYIFNNCKKLKGEIIFPEMPNVANIDNNFANCMNIKKAGYSGVSPAALTSTTNLANGVSLLEEFIYPEIMDNAVQLRPPQNSLFLKKVILPISLQGCEKAFGDSQTGLDWNTTPNVEEITTCDNWGVHIHILHIYYLPKKLKQFDQPAFKISGTSGTSMSITYAKMLEYFNVDFSTVTGNLYLRYCNFPDTELNRIFGALPVVTGGQSIDVRNNPGTAACTPSIAEAKGWTVIT